MKIKNTTRYFLLGTILLLASLLASPNLQAATIDVDTGALDDTNGSQPGCSPREAVMSINNAANVGDCSNSSADAYGTNDTINIPDGTYTLTFYPEIGSGSVQTQGDLDIMTSVDIVGESTAGTIIQANYEDFGRGRIIHISGPGIVVEISNLTVRNGHEDEHCGGGIYNLEGDLTVDHVLITDNSANGGGGIHNAGNGTLNVFASTIDSNDASGAGSTPMCLSGGGGIANDSGASATIDSTTISNNDAIEDYIGGDLSGGGIYNAGFMTVVNSTISANNANQDGGGVYTVAPGTTNLHNVTITLNQCGVGPNRSGNGGGIYDSGANTIRLRNTIVAENLDDGELENHPDCSHSNGSIISEDYNLIGDETGCDDLSPWAANDIVGTFGSEEDPGLDALANNGGPTETHALQATSQAVDGANPAGCTTSDVQGLPIDLDFDQRLSPFNRHVDGDLNGSVICDIGAYELQAEPECGNGNLEPGEECDDGTANSDTEPDACRTDCTLPDCGDGVVDSGEECDDGNSTDGDGCSSDCTNEVEPRCGDGILQAGEECDDGNNNNGDGCSSECQIEEGLIYIQGDRGFSQFNCSLIADGGFSSNHLLSILLMLTGFVGIMFVARRWKA